MSDAIPKPRHIEFVSESALMIGDECFTEVVAHLPLLKDLNMHSYCTAYYTPEDPGAALALRAINHLVVSFIRLRSVNLMLRRRDIPIHITARSSSQSRNSIHIGFSNTELSPQLDVKPWL